MRMIWKRIVVVLACYAIVVSSISIDSLFLNLIQRHISDFLSFNKFYKDILQGVRQHRSIDTVSSPIDVARIRSNNYNEEYLKNSCYETASDLLYAHGYNKTDLNLSINDIQSLLPAVLYTIENPGCKRQSPPFKPYSFFDVWILGFILIVIMKLIHLILFFLAGDHFLALTSNGISKRLSNHADNNQNSTNDVYFSPIKYHLWLGLSFNAFTCGIILGTIIYHLIPHIYEVPNEDFDYIYFLRGTIVLFGVFIFFIVEKLLQFRFKVDEKQFDESDNHTDGMIRLSDVPIIQIHEREHVHHKHIIAQTRLPSNVDSADEETDLKSDQHHVHNEKNVSHHHANTNDENRTRNFILYHLTYHFTNDLIYGCGLSTALAHDRLTGFVLCLMIFSEGFRRHSQLLSSLGRKYAFFFLLLSTLFLLIGYIISGMLIRMNQEFYIRKEYIYSIVYGALFYTVLVILLPELNNFDQRLQIIVKTANQTSKKRRLIKTLILIFQNLFLIIGILIALVLAIIWRYYHRKYICEYISNRDSSRIFCRSS